MSEAQRIDTEVEQRATGQLRVVEPVRGVPRKCLGVVGVQRADLADAAADDDRADERHVREEAGPHGLQDQPLGVACPIHDPLGLVGVDGERLLDENVLAGVDSRQGVCPRGSCATVGSLLAALLGRDGIPPQLVSTTRVHVRSAVRTSTGSASRTSPPALAQDRLAERRQDL